MKRIALVIETSLASGRQIVAGVSRFIDEQNDWTVFQPIGPLGALDLEALVQWEGDGMIARIANPELLKLIENKGLPTVDVIGNMMPHHYPLVKCNDYAIGQTVAKHFIEKGHRHFSYVGLKNELWSLERERGFSETSAAYGKVEVFHIHQETQPNFSSNHKDPLHLWLQDQPTPLATMVASDQLAPLLFEAAHQLGRDIPDGTSVVGVDNDAPFCQLCRPRLSSVEPNHQQVGYQAARILDQLITGQTPLATITEIAEHRLHTRLSSELQAVTDRSLLRALDHIHRKAVSGTNTDEVARAAGLSRSVLQRRIRDQFKTTVGNLILNEKLRTAREMLTQTDLPLDLVAERSGFNCQEYMNHIFRKHLQTTPKRYRMNR